MRHFLFVLACLTSLAAARPLETRQALPSSSTEPQPPPPPQAPPSTELQPPECDANKVLLDGDCVDQGTLQDPNKGVTGGCGEGRVRDDNGECVEQRCGLGQTLLDGECVNERGPGGSEEESSEDPCDE